MSWWGNLFEMVTALERDRYMTVNWDISGHINIYCKFASHFSGFYVLGFIFFPQHCLYPRDSHILAEGCSLMQVWGWAWSKGVSGRTGLHPTWVHLLLLCIWDSSALGGVLTRMSMSLKPHAWVRCLWHPALIQRVGSLSPQIWDMSLESPALGTRRIRKTS
jgi:hypothetical protein